jgi:23S rRNA pseudouridine2605 synthase
VVWQGGQPLRDLAPKVYWLLNKPDATLVSREPQDHMGTIFQLPCLSKVPFHVAAVGRLDFRTEGLLLLSNDGELVHRLSHPKFQIPRTYQVLVSSKLAEAQLEQVRRGGCVLADGALRSCQIQYLGGESLGASTGSWYQLTVREGRNRLVRRLMDFLGVRVLRLVRTQFGVLRLPLDLKPGTYRQLAHDEILDLRRSVGLISKIRSTRSLAN